MVCARSLLYREEVSDPLLKTALFALVAHFADPPPTVLSELTRVHRAFVKRKREEAVKFTAWIEETADAIDAELHRVAVIEIDAELTRLAVEGIKRQRLTVAASDSDLD